MLTQSELKSALRYSEETGIFTWIYSKSKRIKIGDTAGHIRTREGRTSYRIISIKGKNYTAHRLAWLYANGSFPKNQIDHINHNGLDNRILNLRDVTSAENMRNQKMGKNNTSGTVGVHWRKDRDRWLSVIFSDAKKIYLGHFKNKKDAIKARKEAEIKYKYHPNHGKEKVIL